MVAISSDGSVTCYCCYDLNTKPLHTLSLEYKSEITQIVWKALPMLTVHIV